MALIRDEEQRFAGLVQAAAAARGLDPGLVEKDYWAVEALRATRMPIAVPVGDETVHIQTVFKGGTSLSKAFGLIERFSEDVDLLVPLPMDDPTSYSNNQRSDIMAAVTAEVGAVLGIDGERKAGRRGVDFHWNFPYKSMFSSAAVGIAPQVTVELTVMGGQNPQAPRDIISMIGEFAPTIDGFPAYDDLTAVQAVPTLGAERTLVEKLAMLHNSAQLALEGKTGRLQGAGRHYYDVARLLESQQVRQQLSANWVAQIAADSDSWSEKGRFPHTPRPDEGFASSEAFTDSALAELVEESYRIAMTWVWGPKPTLAECVDTVARYADLL